MAKINDTTTYPNTTPVLADHVPGTDVSDTSNDANGEVVTFTWQAVMDLFEANLQLTESNITDLGSYIEDVEGTAVKSTGEVGGTKFLREDGDGTSSWQAIPGGGDALTSSPLSQFAATTSAQLAGVLSDETGSGAAVFATSPTLVTPALGTPSALVLTNATGLPTAGLADDAVTLAKIADAALSGSDATLITGTAGTASQIATWNADGDLVGTAPDTISGLDPLPTPITTGDLLIVSRSGTMYNADEDDLPSGGVDTSGTPVANDFARFTDADTIEGRSYAEVRADLSLEVGTDVQAYDADILKADTADTLTAGFDATDHAAGTKSSGTYTPDPADGNFQTATNGGAHTLAPPGSSCCIVIAYTNNGSAGAITTSGFTKVTGDSFTTTDGDDFLCHITRGGGFSHLHVTALQ